MRECVQGFIKRDIYVGNARRDREKCVRKCVI